MTLGTFASLLGCRVLREQVAVDVACEQVGSRDGLIAAGMIDPAPMAIWAIPANHLGKLSGNGCGTTRCGSIVPTRPTEIVPALIATYPRRANSPSMIVQGAGTTAFRRMVLHFFVASTPGDGVRIHEQRQCRIKEQAPAAEDYGDQHRESDTIDGMRRNCCNGCSEEFPDHFSASQSGRRFRPREPNAPLHDGDCLRESRSRRRSKGVRPR